MTMINHWGLGLVCAGLLLGCSSGAGSTNGGEGSSTAIQLQLTTTAQSGNHFRLGPASFVIAGVDESNPFQQTVEASGEEGDLEVPLARGAYTVTLSPNWVLQRVERDGALTPVTATLQSPAVQQVSVFDFQLTPIHYAFHLGESGLDIGIGVDEGNSTGTDGIITPTGDGRFQIMFNFGGSACCWSSVEDARAAYPNLILPVGE